MQLGHPLSFLLAALLFALANVDAAPVKRQPGMVTLSLKRLPKRTDVPPAVLLQQHINRSHRRHARMIGREGPTEDEMTRRVAKRLNQANFPSHGKRYNRVGGTFSGSGNVDATIESAGGLGNDTQSNPSNGTVPDLSNQNSTSQGFPQAGLDAAIAGDLTPANTPTANNSLGLDIEANDVGYVATVQMGTPPTNYSILMDSGSADFWVASISCQSDAGGDCGKHVPLGSTTSSSFQASNQPFQVTYGTGQVSGFIITDNVLIGDLALDQHSFGVATVESQDFSNDTTKFDGLMGLAQSSLSNQGVPTPVEALAKQGAISEAITSYKISRFSDGLNDGEITFGGLDETKFDPKSLVTFDNVSPLGFWEGAMSVSVNGQDLGLNPRTGILDTGTTLIVAPGTDAETLHAMIPGSQSDGQGGFTIPCTNEAVVSMVFGGQSFDINPVDLLFLPVDQNNLQGDCISGISSGQIGGPTQWLVGDVFLKNVYYSTNVDKNQISLAKLA